MKPRKQLGVTRFLLRRFGLWVIDGRSPTGTARLELPQVGRLRWSSAEFAGYTRHRHGSIRRVGLRARTVQGNTRVQPGAVATLRKNKRPLMHRCGYPQGGSKIEDRERTAHSPTRRADPPLERGVRPGPRISEEMGALSDGACLYIGITIRDPSLRSELPGLA